MIQTASFIFQEGGITVYIDHDNNFLQKSVKLNKQDSPMQTTVTFIKKSPHVATFL